MDQLKTIVSAFIARFGVRSRRKTRSLWLEKILATFYTDTPSRRILLE